jgi:hypothetical protein
MRRVPVVLMALSLTALGCSVSDVDPDATVRISGRALDAQGRPLSGAKVLLFKQADLGEILVGTTLAIGTLSTICLLPDPPAVCNKARTVTADQNGEYEFELKGSDTQGTLGTESTLNVVFSGPAAQGSTSVSFTVKDTTVAVPEARLWKAAPQLSDSDGQIRLSWKPLPAAAGGDAGYSAQLLDGETGSVFFSQSASDDEATVDPRLLEDRPGSIAVNAGTSLSGGSGTGDVRAYYLSAPLPVDDTAGAPPSRGRPCAAVIGTAPTLGDPPETCPMTDGDLTTLAGLRAPGKKVVTGAVIDLGSVRPIDLVVTRGFAGQFLVEVSTDGTTWQPVGSELGRTVAIDPAGTPSARFVRVRSPTGLDQSLASEISVW